jgi:cytochrome c553
MGLWLCRAVLSLLAVLLWLPSSTVADPAMLRGATLAHACAACHGPNGRSQGAIPSIDNLSAEDFQAVLKAFRADSLKGTVMNRIAKGLDDAEIDAIATYFVTLRPR